MISRQLGAALVLIAVPGCSSCGDRTSTEPSTTTACTVEDVVVHAEVRRADAAPGPMSSTTPLRLGVVIGNPCTEPISFGTSSLCLANRFTLSAPDGSIRTGGASCAQTTREWTLPPMDGESIGFELGNLDPGRYTVSVPVAIADAPATAAFTVE